jgi:Tfp pilus assembly protein PilN
MMPRLWLDYQRPAPGRQLPGLIVLGVGVAAIIMVGSSYSSVTAELDEVQASVARLRRETEQLPAHKTSLPGVPGIPDTMAPLPAARQAAHVPAYSKDRWELLFSSLEAAGEESVTLLALRSGTGEVQLAGEAVNLVAVLDYVKRLQSARAFGNVYLTQSEVVREHPQRPVRFTLIAEWREGLP